MKTLLIRVKSLTETPYSYLKVPFETTLVEKTEEKYVAFHSLKEKYEQKGYNVLWIEYMRRLVL